MPTYDLRSSQKDAVLIPFLITVVGGTPTLTEGGTWMTLVDGGVGLYQLTFGGQYGAPSGRTPIVEVCCTNDAGNEYIANVIEASLLTTGFTIEVNDDAGTASDRTVMGTVVWFRNVDPQ